MKAVNEFEARLLRILRCLMGRVSVDQVLTLFVKSIDRPACLSRNCVELAMDYLSKGVTEWLARSGWQDDRFLVNEDQISSGRLWLRHSPEMLSLRFSPNSMEWLLWLTSENFVEPKQMPAFDSSLLTPGDRLLFMMTFDAVKNTLGADAVLQQSGLKNSGLIWLMFPDRVAECNFEGEPELDLWFHKDHIWVLEALQMRLSNSWTNIELNKRESSNYEAVRRTGELQSQVLKTFLDATESARRRDLARFVLCTVRKLSSTPTALHRTGETSTWFRRLDVKALRMAERSAVYQAALAVFHSLKRLSQWNDEARRIGYYDEGYQASQLWKSDWERLNGDETYQWARRIIQEVDPVKAISQS